MYQYDNVLQKITLCGHCNRDFLNFTVIIGTPCILVTLEFGNQQEQLKYSKLKVNRLCIVYPNLNLSITSLLNEVEPRWRESKLGFGTLSKLERQIQTAKEQSIKLKLFLYI